MRYLLPRAEQKLAQGNHGQSFAGGVMTRLQAKSSSDDRYRLRTHGKTGRQESCLNQAMACAINESSAISSTAMLGWELCLAIS